jgi:tryptophan-rich sensory protein
MHGSGLLKLLACLAVVLAAGGIGSLATARAIPTWYRDLAKPSFNPPNWLFGPAWTALYLMMAVAAWLVWKQGIGAPGVKLALAVFLVQLVLNALWSVLFFGLRSPLAGLVGISGLWLAVLATIILILPCLDSGRRPAPALHRLGQLRRAPQRRHPPPQPLVAAASPSSGSCPPIGTRHS